MMLFKKNNKHSYNRRYFLFLMLAIFSLASFFTNVQKVSAAKVSGMCVIGNGSNYPYYAIRVNMANSSSEAIKTCSDIDGGTFYAEGSTSPHKVCITDPYNQNIPHYEILSAPSTTCGGVLVAAGSAIPSGLGTSTAPTSPGGTTTPPTSSTPGGTTTGTFNPWETTCTSGTSAEDSSVCKELNDPNKKNPFDGSEGVIPTIANFMAAIGGLIAVVVIILSGLRMITSSGDSAKLTQSRNAIIYASAGIVVIVLARTIIKFVLDKL